MEVSILYAQGLRGLGFGHFKLRRSSPVETRHGERQAAKEAEKNGRKIRSGMN